MAAPTEAASTGVESTYKARDVESVLDIYFYRPIGYQLARFFAAIAFTPSMVSLLGAALGVTAGYLYGYRDLRLNIIGIALHILTNALDNADGQLARLTNRGSLHGAIMDGLADYAVFVSIYVNLALRHVAGGGSAAVWLLAVGAGLSHGIQSMMIDYYRNAYLQFVAGKQSADANSSETVGEAFGDATWRRPWRKLALWNYLNYTKRQEALAPNLLKLRHQARAVSPDWLAQEFREDCRPLIKWCNSLATIPRMLLLFALLLIGRPTWYFVAEITVFNAILVYVMWQHDAAFQSLLSRIDAKTLPR